MKFESQNIAIDTDGLETEALNLAIAKQSSRQKEILETYKTWTENSNSGIYSGYKQRCLEEYYLEQSIEAAQDLKKTFKNALVLGIGGSALGAKCALNALSWRTSSTEFRRIDIIDNLDPIFFEFTLASIDLNETLVVVVTKAGGTLETISALTLLMNRYFNTPEKMQKHLFCITDPKSGALRKFVEKHQLKNLPVPSDVGGRFSVLTPVATFALEFSGVDTAALMKGAKGFFNNSNRLPFIAQCAERLHALEEAGYFGHVLMPYSTMLKATGEWFVQLWGESLGKKHPKGYHTGTAPLAAVGATDQHSLLQLLVEGPNKLVNGFVSVKNWPEDHDPLIEKIPEEFSSLSFANGKKMSTILNAEKTATAQVLKEMGRPVYEIELKTQNEEAIGEFFAFYMDLVVMTAASLGINPFDQPGVELGKKLMPKLLA